MENLSWDIQKEFPGIKGFGVRNMWDMARFYAEYQSNELRVCHNAQIERIPLPHLFVAGGFSQTKGVLTHPH